MDGGAESDKKFDFKTNLKGVKEEFFLYLMASMYLVKRFEFMTILQAEVKFNIEEEPDNIDDYGFSDNFCGNFFRLACMFQYQENLDRIESVVPKMKEKLDLAIHFFEEDASDWGLGKTYYLLGRTLSLLTDNKENNFRKTKKCYEDSLSHFGLVDHYRGIHIVAKDLYML